MNKWECGSRFISEISFFVFLTAVFCGVVGGYRWFGCLVVVCPAARSRFPQDYCHGILHMYTCVSCSLLLFLYRLTQPWRPKLAGPDTQTRVAVLLFAVLPQVPESVQIPSIVTVVLLQSAIATMFSTIPQNKPCFLSFLPSKAIMYCRLNFRRYVFQTHSYFTKQRYFAALKCT